MARLDAADGIVLVVGGAGAGKTTLLDGWVAARGGMLIDLAERGAAGREHGGRPAWTTELAGGGVLAVDGVTEADLAEVGGLPRRGGIVVAAEDELALDAAVRIGVEELAFAEDETYQVLAAAFGDAEAADELAPDLHLLTSGWPALVALAAAWLARSQAGDRQDCLRSLAQVDAGLAEHLVPALLAALSDDERELVRRMARLPGVDAALADRLDLTEDLAAVAPFVQAVARRPGWFAVPHGWRNALQRELPMSERAVAELRAAYAAGM